MRVVLSAGKRGHYYLTARALQEHGLLGRFITGIFFRRGGLLRRFLPERLVRTRSDDGIPATAVTSLWPPELAFRTAKPLMGRRARMGMHAYNVLYDLASLPFVLRGGDVFHFANTYGAYAGAAAKRRGIRVVVDQQSVHPAYARDVLGESWDAGTDSPTVERIVRELHLADLILVPSRFVFDENVRRGIPAAKQRVVPFGVDTSMFAPGRRARRAADPFRVLFAGGIQPRKGVQDLLEAITLLGDPRMELTLVGARAHTAESALARYAGRFTHVPAVPPGRLAELYREFDALCLPSLCEGSALVTYEAMASALPCIVTPATGSVVTDRHDGLIVPTRSPRAIADALAELADRPEWAREMGRNARRTACDHDVAQYGERLIAAYRDFFGSGELCRATR